MMYRRLLQNKETKNTQWYYFQIPFEKPNIFSNQEWITPYLRSLGVNIGDKELYEGDIISIKRSNINNGFEFSKLGKFLIEKFIDEALIEIMVDDRLTVKYSLKFIRGGDILTYGDIYDESDSRIYEEISYDIEYLSYLSAKDFCELNGNIFEK